MSTLYVDDIQPKTNGGLINAKGMIIQVVQQIGTASLNTTSTSFVNYSPSNISITPSSTSSKILVMMECSADSFDAGDNASLSVKIYRDGSALSNQKTDRAYVNGGTGVLSRGSATINYLDSPSTTSSVTYQLYFKRDQGSYQTIIENASITLMEIGG